MFRRRTKTRAPSSFLHSSNRGSDIVKPDNTSLIVNQSKALEGVSEESPEDMFALLDDSVNGLGRRSSAVMNSMSQKQQSTPKKKSSPLKPLKEILDDGSNIQLSSSSSSSPSSSPMRKSGRQIFSLEKVNTPKPSSKRKELTFFEQIIQGCGAKEVSGCGSYMLSEDQAVFSLKVNSTLKENNNVDKFLKSLEEHISNIDQLKKMLAHTETAEDCDVARGPVQEPLIRLLLNVDVLQTKLLGLLMQKLADFIIDSDAENDDFHIVTSILRQIRFLNRSKDSEVAERLFEIIDVAATSVQREIIFMLPEIVTEEENEEVSSRLIDLLKFNSLLTHVIIDALTNLPLSAQLRSQVRTKMLTRLEKCPPEYLPLLVQFIISRCDNSELMKVISSLREELPFTMHHYELRELNKKSGKNSVDEDSYVKLTFENLKFSVMSSKQMTDTWMKIITNIKSSNEFRCLDLVMLIIMYSNVCGRKNQILSLTRNKIKANILSEIHIQQMFKILLVVAMEYSSAILELASVLLKSFDMAVSDFAVVLYQASFVNFNFYLRQNVMSEILLHLGTGTPMNVNMALVILDNLVKNHRDIVSEHTVCIMGMLIKLPDFEPLQVRSLIDVISTLVFSDTSEDVLGLQDELQMFIRKQVSSSKVDQHRKGVLGAMMFVKHAVALVGEENDQKRLAEANSLLEMALGSYTSCEARKTFFNDELATMLREASLNATFVRFWNERTFKLVADNLFFKNLELECEYFPMSLQYPLDSESEKLVFPVLDFVLKAHEKKHSSVPLVVIPSALRLLWCSEKNFNKIVSFMSASAIMPEPTVYENFLTYDVGQQKAIMDCLFLCSNYFIECINAFCTQKTTENILIRIKQLIEVRRLIVRFLPETPDYFPPFCQFYAPVQRVVLKKRNLDPKKPKRGKKRKSDGTAAETSNQSILDSTELPCTSASTSTSVEIIGHAKANNEEIDLQLYRGCFRELHCHTYKLLRMELKLNPSKVFKKTKLSDVLVEDMSWTYRPTEKPEMSPSDLLFLLEDFIYKCDQILKDSRRATPFNFKSKTSVSAVEHIPAESFILGAIKILPKLCIKLDLLAGYCQDLLKANDEIHDAPGMFPKDSADIKLCLAALLRIVADIISWRGFQSSENKTNLRDALVILSRKGKTAANSISTLSLEATDAGNYLASFNENVLLLSGAISLVRGVKACFTHSSPATRIVQSKVIETLCYGLLCRPWFTVTGTPERGAVYNQHVDVLLKTYFAAVEDKLEVVAKVAQIAVDEAANFTGKESVMETFKTINKSNFPLLYRTMCEALVSAASTEVTRDQDDYEVTLGTWGKVVHTMLMLVEIVKIHSSRINLSSLLKRSQSIIQLFLTKGMPVMESALRVKSNEVLKVLKTLQAVTRFLHSICCHSKITSDSVVASHVPTIRAQCERITLEVKGILILNKIPLDCITIAVLKNRDLQGNDILSQETMEGESESESELPPEDTSEETDMNRDSSTQESNSENY